MSDFLYILTNESFPELVKIGFTTRLPKERCSELSAASGVPTPFQVIYSQPVSNGRAAEQDVHHFLSRYRKNEGREFFQVSVDKAIDAVKQCSDRYIPGVNHVSSPCNASDKDMQIFYFITAIFFLIILSCIIEKCSVSPEQNKILVYNRPKPESFRPDASLLDIQHEPINWQEDPETVSEQKTPVEPYSDKPNNLQLMKYKFIDKDDDLKPVMLYSDYTTNRYLLLATQRNNKIFEVIDKIVPNDSRPQEIWYNIILYNIAGWCNDNKNLTGWISSEDLGYEAIPLVGKK